jgi:hypothetical protein
LIIYARRRPAKPGHHTTQPEKLQLITQDNTTTSQPPPQMEQPLKQ